MSKQRLLRIDDHINRNYLDTEKLTGALTAIYRKGRLAHYSALGLMDREQNKPVLWDTIYRIYSMTKPITSVALMMLYERGFFQLDDPVAEYIPDRLFPGWNVDVRSVGAVVDAEIMVVPDCIDRGRGDEVPELRP